MKVFMGDPFVTSFMRPWWCPTPAHKVRSLQIMSSRPGIGRSYEALECISIEIYAG